MGTKKEELELLDSIAIEHIKRQSKEIVRKSGSDANRKNTLAAARESLFLENFNLAASKYFKNKIQVNGILPKLTKEKKRIVNILLSDQHYGSGLDPKEVPSIYTHEEEARRTARITLEVADYKRQYRNETVLYVHLLGDVIQGQLHDLRDGVPLAQQSAAAIYLLSQQIAFWSKEFPRVEVFCTPGNHGRNLARHPDRAVNQKWDSIETVIYYGVKCACSYIGNVGFNIPKTPYYTYKCFDQYGFCTHGDTVLRPGYPAKTIDVAGIRKQINEWNGSSKDKYSLFAVGHVHTGSLVHLPNGAIFMSNGCLIPTDSYALSVGYPSVTCGQWLWESVPGYIVGDHRFIRVDTITDKDKTLDKIIKPFKDL